jgi:branched-chain amino acid transport system ATP-binding protein
LGEPLLKVNNIDVFHETFQALWDVSLVVNADEIVCLGGANASGKSSVLHAVSGFLHPAKGHIEFDGQEISHLTPPQIVSLGLSQVPEGRQVFPDMTVLENLVIGSYNRGARAKRKETLKVVYELFPILEERKKQVAKTLSGGEQQMLAIGRGLMASPKLLMLDEMSLGLAPIIVNEIYKVLSEIRRRHVAILFVEENLKRSLQHAQRAYILKTGRVVLSGNMTELQEVEELKRAYFGTAKG